VSRNETRWLPAARSFVPGVVWPAIGNDLAAQLRSLLFQLDHSQWLSPEELQAQQLHQLKALLRHARVSVPHYVATLGAVDIERLDWARFQELPTLMRRQIQSRFEVLQSGSLPADHGAVSEGQTSGSTGTPIRFRRTAASRLFWHALTMREHLWHQRDFSGKLAAIRVKVEEKCWPDWGAPAAALFHTGPGATLNIRADVSYQLEWLRRENPDYLITHASNLGALAELSIRRGIRLPRLRQARSFSETLRPGLRETVRAAWDVEVADGYSCEEAGVLASQCPGREHYHVQAENVLVEVLDEAGRACEPGETGKVVITPLHNFAMPLIRYELGDYAEAGEPCPCGRGLPVLARIHGRQRNMIRLPDGRRHWPSFPAKMWCEVAPVEQFQLVQRASDQIEIRYVMSRPISADEQQRLENALAERLGHRFSILWRRLTAIERGPGYKFEDFISELPDG
jgi:phenylacetate-CoA ligase